MTDTLDRPSYEAAQRQLILLAQVAQETDWPAMIRSIERSESVGAFFVSPITFTAGVDRLRHLKDMARHANSLVAAFQQLNEMVSKQDASGVSRRARALAPAGDDEGDRMVPRYEGEGGARG